MIHFSNHLSPVWRDIRLGVVLSITLLWSLTAPAQTTITSPSQPVRPSSPVIAQPQPIQPRPVQPRPVQPRPVQPHPVQPGSAHPHPIHPHPVQPRPNYSGFGVDVIVAPQTEHWPSNYVPDNYRLRGYGGNDATNGSEQQDTGKQICRHADGGTTWSTAGVPCPDDRGAPSGTKTWSTQ